MRKYLLLLATVAALTLLTVSPATAVGPTRVAAPIESFTLEDVCSFHVLIEPLRNNEFITTFSDKQGNAELALTTGALSVRVTNLSTLKSLDVNIPGPGRLETHEDDSTTLITEGTWLFFLFSDQLPSFSPRMFLIAGRMVVEFDASGNTTEISRIRGHMQDLCAALADP